MVVADRLTYTGCPKIRLALDIWQLIVILTPGNTWGVQIGSKQMDCIYPVDTFCILQVMYEWNDSKITQCDQIVWFNWVENWYDREVYWEIQGLHS